GGSDAGLGSVALGTARRDPAGDARDRGGDPPLAGREGGHGLAAGGERSAAVSLSECGNKVAAFKAATSSPHSKSLRGDEPSDVLLQLRVRLAVDVHHVPALEKV